MSVNIGYPVLMEGDITLPLDSSYYITEVSRVK